MVKLSSALALLPLFSAATQAAPEGRCATPPKVPAKAVYFLSNADENSVVALKVNKDGTLSEGSITSTGGKGGAGVNADGVEQGPDALFTQDSVVTSGGYLAAVNPGSNTLSFFKIDDQDATKLTMIGDPIDTLGDFPTTVAMFDLVNKACVVNTGTRNGVACFEMSDHGLKPLDKKLRPLGLTQTTPPTGFMNTVSDAFFTDQGAALMVWVKGTGEEDSHGFVATYPIEDVGKGDIAWDPIKSSPEGLMFLFGTVQVPGTARLVTTDPSVGAALLTAQSDATVETTALTPIEGQNATCWAIYNKVADQVYVTDVLNNRMVGVNPADGTIASNVVLDNGNIGMQDIASSGDYLYALAIAEDGKATVVVLDARGGPDGVKHVQNFKPEGLETQITRLQGMAVCE